LDASLIALRRLHPSPRPRSGFETGRSVTGGTTTTGDGKEVPMPIETKEQLYREAKRLRIKGRSKMSKGQLKAAISRHRM
jgi:hypothetical protein